MAMGHLDYSSATELVKPTSTATKPALTDDRLRSLKNCIARLCRLRGWVAGARHNGP
jgi:hypothetical protein